MGSVWGVSVRYSLCSRAKLTISFVSHSFYRSLSAHFGLSLGLASYIYSLDGCTTSAYLTFATSAFGGHGLMSAIQTAQSLIGRSYDFLFRNAISVLHVVSVSHRTRSHFYSKYHALLADTPYCLPLE